MSSTPLAATVPVRVAAELIGVPQSRIEELIRSGAVRVEPIDDRPVVDLAEVERAVREAGPAMNGATSTDNDPETEWVTPAEASRRTGLTPYQLRGMIVGQPPIVRSKIERGRRLVHRDDADWAAAVSRPVREVCP